ncbi:MAG: polyphosphate polymerase domain-containing protein [Lachnospiraceae bacterium]|nr:polyphosphate polymerase domain-containing protein [Lachnospiraceae bacterium]
MDTREQFRHEYKFGISTPELYRLRGCLGAFMQEDEHTRDFGGYEIRSVYFDDIDDVCYRMNEAGADPRVKYRIRCYNGSDSVVKLEKKKKIRGMTSKQSCMLSPETAQLLTEGYLPDISKDSLEESPELFRELAVLMHTRGFRPKVMVVYNRAAYVHPSGNVRITFDTQISACGECGRLFEKTLSLWPVMDTGRELLEVKYDGILPGYIREGMDTGTLRQQTFSKYYLCRNALMIGGRYK